jgi:3' terminal RNA ribose 2'-O-methyltransferase Hen1
VLLTLTMTGPDAPVLGHLLHKHPDRVQTFTLPVGDATVFYPESSAERVSAALLLEIDPIAMVKRRLRSREGVSLTDYVTDRPYAASSMLAVALGRVFNTALNGRSDSHPEQAAAALPLEIRVPAVPARAARRAGSGADLVRRLFEPLGWAVDPTERAFGPDGSWGAAPYLDVTLTGRVRLADALSYLYVLLPVLDNAKHYWVGSDEVAKLVRRGEGWLASHPERELIVRRYLASRRDYVEDATARLQALEDAVDDSEPEPDADGEAAAPLKLQRLQAVLDAVHEVGARRVVDLGCGEGLYLRALLAEPAVTELVGVDVSPRTLERAERRLGLERLPDQQRAKLSLWQSSATYRDDRLAGFDAILLVEVIEHLDRDRVGALEASVFGAARPAHVVLTTPNRDHNAVFGLPAGQWRHPDHRFEWTRAEFAGWADGVAARYGYRVELRGVGQPDAVAGPPTQLALFSRDESGRSEERR